MEQLKISSNVSKLHSVLGKKLYESKYSWISEICQNAVDSHRMSGVKEPVVIGIRFDPRDRNDLYFFVEDKGLSFTDKEDFVNKVLTILESGKTSVKTADENCAMGEHGIGTISVSAYQDEWTYTVVTPTGEKFKCLLREEEGKGLGYEFTDLGQVSEPKSVLFEVKVAYNGTPALLKEMKSKLAYFKDIEFRFDSDLVRGHPWLLTLNTDFEIFESENFRVSTMSSEDYLHISLDQYTYPINWGKIGIAPIQMNVGLRFTMADGLKSSLTREQLQFDDNYSRIIKDKIKKVATWFVQKYNDNTTATDFTSIIKLQQALNSPKSITIGKKQFNISEFVNHSTTKPVTPRFKDVNEQTYARFMTYADTGAKFYDFRYFINGAGSKTKVKHKPFNITTNTILVDKEISPKMMEYLKASYQGWTLAYKHKIPLDASQGTICYRRMAQLDKQIVKNQYKTTGINILRERIKQFQILENALTKDYMTRLSDIVIPEHFMKVERALPTKRAKIDPDALTGELGVRYAERMMNGSTEFACKFVMQVLQVPDLKDLKQLHIYGADEDRSKLDLIYEMYKSGKDVPIVACMIGVMQQPGLKKLNLSNFMHVDEYLQGKHGTFRGMMTAFRIDQDLIQKKMETFKRVDIIQNYISKEIATDMKELQAYVAKWNVNFNHLGKDKSDALVKLADDLKLYDQVPFDLMTKMNKIIDNLDYVAFMDRDIHPQMTTEPYVTRHKLTVGFLRELTKYREGTHQWEGYKLDV